jgi:hypothetical protein
MNVPWTPVISVPKTWIQLPLASRWDPEQWAEQKCAEVLGADVSDKTRRLLIETIAEVTVTGRESKSQMLGGLVFYPSFDRYPPICTVAIDGFSPAPGDASVDLDSFRESNGKPQENTIGDIETTVLELPAGPALRFNERRTQQVPHMHVHTVGESVLFAVRPYGIPDAVTLMATWMEPQYRDMLIKMADGMAQSLKIVPREN